MAASDVAIANLALTKLGEQRITDLEDDTKPAREVNAVYTMLRDQLQRRYVWRFCVKRESLAALATTPEFRYSYEYQLPSDCLRVLQVGEFYPAIDLSDLVAAPNEEFQIEGRKILHDDAGPLYIRYLARIDDPAQFDVCFDEALAAFLAYNLAEALTQSNSKRELAAADFKRAIKDAVIANAIESPPSTLQDDTWVAVRV